MLRKAFLLGICLAFLISANCSAEERKDEWHEKTFDFKTLKTIVVQLTINSDIVLSDIDQKKLAELVDKQILTSGDQRIRLISPAQLEDSIGKLVNTDMGLLRIEDTEKYKQTMTEYTPLIADGVLKVNIKALSTTQEFVPASTYTYVTYQTTYVSTPVYLPNGGVYYTTQAVQIPVTQIGFIPAHYENVGHAGAELTLETYKNAQKVWILLDLRDGKEKQPLEMTERIFKRAMDKFRELTECKKPV